MTVGELPEALAGYPDDALFTSIWSACRARARKRFVVNVQPNYAGWTDREQQAPRRALWRTLPKELDQVTRDRVVESAQYFRRRDWPYGRWDWRNSPRCKRTFGRRQGRDLNLASAGLIRSANWHSPGSVFPRFGFSSLTP